MSETKTPLAAAFFKMVLSGAMAGIVITAVLTFFSQLSSWPMNIPAMLFSAGFGFFVGMIVAGAAAGCAIGLHAFAAATTPKLQVPAAALGGAMGPVLLAFLLLGPSAEAPVPPLIWAVLVPVCSLAAVYFTRPLRRASTVKATLQSR